MGRRTQITITDEQHARLTALSEETGMSMSELVRRALDRTYAGSSRGSLAASFGAWRDHDLDGAEYVERLRGGLRGRLKRSDGSAR